MNRELTEAEHLRAEVMHDPDAELEALLVEHLRAEAPAAVAAPATPALATEGAGMGLKR